MRTLYGRGLSGGRAEGKVLLSDEPISFLGGVDPETGELVEPGHGTEGRNLSGRVLAFPRGKGSTVGSYVLYQLSKNGRAPSALVNEEAETIIVAGAILADIPLVDGVDISELRDGSTVRVDGSKGEVVLENDKDR